VFLLVVNGLILTLGLSGARWLGPYLFQTHQYDWTLRLVLINTFVVGFYYLPFHVMRIEQRTRLFIALGFCRSLATIVMRIVLVIGMALGVHGVVVADIAVTSVFTLVMLRWFAPIIRPMFSPALLRESLRFGLPRLPHGVAHQVIGSSDRYILGRFVTLHEIGLYATGSSLGLGLKLFLSSVNNTIAGRQVDAIFADSQFQADVAGVPVEVAAIPETTALGAAFLAGLATGVWKTPDELRQRRTVAVRYEPHMSADKRESLYAGWLRAVERSRGWALP